MCFIKITLKGLFISLRDILPKNRYNYVFYFKFAVKSSVADFIM